MPEESSGVTMRLVVIAVLSVGLASGIAYVAAPFLVEPPFPAERAHQTVAKVDKITVRHILDSNDVPTGRTTQYADLTFQDRLGEKNSVRVSVTALFNEDYDEGDALTLFYDPENLDHVDFEGKTVPSAVTTAFILAAVLTVVFFLGLSMVPAARPVGDGDAG